MTNEKPLSGVYNSLVLTGENLNMVIHVKWLFYVSLARAVA